MKWNAREMRLALDFCKAEHVALSPEAVAELLAAYREELRETWVSLQTKRGKR